MNGGVRTIHGECVYENNPGSNKPPRNPSSVDNPDPAGKRTIYGFYALVSLLMIGDTFALYIYFLDKYFEPLLLSSLFSWTGTLITGLWAQASQHPYAIDRFMKTMTISEFGTFFFNWLALVWAQYDKYEMLNEPDNILMVSYVVLFNLCSFGMQQLLHRRVCRGEVYVTEYCL
jgi:hypothetical protein